MNKMDVFVLLFFLKFFKSLDTWIGIEQDGRFLSFVFF